LLQILRERCNTAYGLTLNSRSLHNLQLIINGPGTDELLLMKQKCNGQRIL